jgi:uncharacterized protein involved in exopolysaccharide biosynthesis/Mrp family chromosome partitioning ATPase
MSKQYDFETRQDERFNEIDLHALSGVLASRRAIILWPTLAALVLSTLAVNIVTPRYTAESEILLENQENFFTRPHNDQTGNEGPPLVDPEAVASQIQLLTSRDLERRAIKALKLEGNPEFDPLANGMGALKRVLVLLGVMRDPTLMAPEDRILDIFSQRLSVYSPTKTRVLTIDFQSRDPDLAARAANTIAELYLAEQSDAKRVRARAAADSLHSLIEDLQVKLADASAKVEQFRSTSGLLAGANNMTISGQQLAELNTDLSRARTSQADAQAKATLIREMLKKGRLTEVSDIANNDLVRRIGEQRVSLRAQLASESRTLLPGHPRIKELTAQLADLDSALRTAVEQTTAALENEAHIAGNRVSNLEAILNQQKKTTGIANADEIRLRELQRLADAYKDQLDSSTAKYQAALARDDSPATPADARIISRATPPQEASYPKKTPLVIFATLATLLGTSGFVIAGELLSGRAFPGRAALPQNAPSSSRSRTPRSKNALVEPRFDRPNGTAPAQTPRPPADDVIASLVQKIMAKSKGKDDANTCVVLTGLRRDVFGNGIEVALARALSESGRAILLDLDGHPGNLQSLSSPDELDYDEEDFIGLTDLLSGSASFAEVILRDEISKLHFIAAGRKDRFDFTDFDLILDALLKTYDFVLMITPPIDCNQTAYVAASYADFVVLAAEPDDAKLTEETAERFLKEGVQEVISVDLVVNHDAFVRDVA